MKAVITGLRPTPTDEVMADALPFEDQSLKALFLLNVLHHLPDRQQESFDVFRRVADGDLKSPIRPVDFVPPERLYREVSPGHAVQVWGAEWDDPSDLVPATVNTKFDGADWEPVRSTR